MILSTSQTELKFSEKTRVVTPAQSIVEALSDKKDIGRLERPHEPGVRLKNEQTKQALLWSYDSCSFLCEDVPNYNSVIKETISVLGKINSVAPIGKLISRVLTTYWIQPVIKQKFKPLQDKYKKYFIRQSEFFNNCVDSSVIAEMKYGNYTLHHQSGIMGIDQLQDNYRVFKMKEAAPKVFVFLSTRIVNNDMVQYSREDIESFLSDSFKICLAHSSKFQEIMEKIL